MQCKRIEKIAPVQPKQKKEKYITTVQVSEGILILDVFNILSKTNRKIYRGRQAVNIKSGEYAQYDPSTKKWSKKKFGNLLDLDMKSSGYYSWTDARKRANFDNEEMEKTVKESLMRMSKLLYTPETFDLINERERSYDRDRRQRIEDNRVMRVEKKMALVPAVPEDIREWIWKMEGAEDYLFRDKESGEWHCTSCRASLQACQLRREDGEKKIRHNDRVICPGCRKTVTAKTRVAQIREKSHFYLAQRMDSRMGAWRCFDVTLSWTRSGRRVCLNEASRIIMYDISTGSKYAGEIFYNQWPADGGIHSPKDPYFDSKSNPANRRMGKGYLYPEGIDRALDGTAYQRCGRLISQMAAAGLKLDYNRLVSTQGSSVMTGITEYLFKGRFRRLLEETIDRIVPGWNSYYGSLDIKGTTIEEIFGIRDRQLINRIRAADGGEIMVRWMQMCDREGSRISQETLQWMEKSRILPDDIKFLENRMSPQQVMNYVRRQQAEEYKGLSASRVIDQWKDYMNMLDQLGRKADDEMMFRPRQLKRRHDDCVEEINAQRIRKAMNRDPETRRQEADRMNKRFPGAEKILASIKEKYEYEDDQYIITVPQSLMDIITEGQALHHCAGATDRYFDRIMQRETYICFLRKKEDPDTPYYTIEVEPGGTIRQHRGYLDEEPNIEQIKPFLRRWQQEIHKRLTKEDRKHAAASAIKRQQNIEELKANRNTRVLKGLIEDFMPQENAEGDAPETALMAAGA